MQRTFFEKNRKRNSRKLDNLYFNIHVVLYHGYILCACVTNYYYVIALFVLVMV